MFKLPLSSNNLRVSQVQYFWLEPRRRLFFLWAHYIPATEGKRKEIPDTRGALGCSAEAASGDQSRGLWVPANVFPFRWTPPSRASALPASAFCPGSSTVSRLHRPRWEAAQTPYTSSWEAPPASWAGAASLLLPCKGAA